MSRQLPPLNALRAFEAAARHSSFSKAGEELRVSHSSISRHVRGLEARIGVKLFTNLPRGVGLTRVGTAYLKDISQALDLISGATERIAPQQSGVVRLSCEPTFALRWLMPALGKFKQRHPQIELWTDPSSELVDLQQTEFDLAIRFCRADPIGLETDLISQAPVYLVGSPDLLTENIELDDPETILSSPLLVESQNELWADWFEKAGLPLTRLTKPYGSLRTMLAIEAAVAGQGLMLLSSDLIAGDLNAGRLVRFSNIGLDYGTYRLVHTKPALQNQNVETFRRWLLKETSNLRTENNTT